MATKEEYEKYIDELKEQLQGREDERHRALLAQTDAARHQNEHIRGKDRRLKLERFGRNLGTVDGSSREALRRWIDGVDYAKAWVNATDLMVLELIGALVGGALASHLLTFKEKCSNAQPPKEMTWEVIKAEIKKSFLDNDEEEFLREVVDRTKQQPYEDTRAYAQRYLEAIRKAYTVDDLTVQLTQERLIKQYIRGLRDLEVRRQVHLSRPTTLEDATTESHTASRAFSLAEAPYRDDRVIEPMEIGRIDLTDGNKDAAKPAPLQVQIDQLRKDVQSMTTELRRQRTRQKPAQQPRQTFNQAPRRPAGGDTRRCYGCGRMGHIMMRCPQVKNQQKNPKNDRTSGTAAWQKRMEAQISAINDTLAPKN